ncbi:MAG: hypothetical protein QW628_13235 [Thermofilum sp.]
MLKSLRVAYNEYYCITLRIFDLCFLEEDLAKKGVQRGSGQKIVCSLPRWKQPVHCTDTLLLVQAPGNRFL